MNKNFNEAVKEAMELGKNIICVVDPFDMAHNYDANKFVSVDNYSDVGDAQQLLGLGTDDFIYMESVWSNKGCILINVENYRFDLGQQALPECNNRKERTEEFVRFYNKLAHMPVMKKEGEVDKFITNHNGSLIITVDVDAIGDNAGDKKEWVKVLDALALRYNGVIYKEELYR